tara:strand:- start:111 stop:1064 length:954 start_codon:yes stop_codon:yes gene_type:complete
MKKLLVVRNDKLGDLILILPALKLIKSSCRDIQIDCLVDRKYSEISSITKYIDNTIYDSTNLLSVINNENYDFSISFFSSFVTGYVLWLSNIPKRYAPATKLAQIFYNKKIKQNRSLSLKSEYEYNNNLAEFFLKDNLYSIPTVDNACISLNERSISNKDKILIFVHPFTGGSSKTLSGDDFIQLCFELNKYIDCKFILHCATDDFNKCQKLVKKAEGLDISTINPTSNLIEMYKNINSCDLFIAGSTGPLHVAASLNKKTVGFYPSKRSSTLVRWDTINDSSKKLTYSDMGNDKKFIKVDLKKIANEISRDLLNQS